MILTLFKIPRNKSFTFHKRKLGRKTFKSLLSLSSVSFNCNSLVGVVKREKIPGRSPNACKKFSEK